MVAWTNRELQKMQRMHENGRPPTAVLIAAFSRHSPGSVRSTCYRIGFRQKYRVKWIRIAHEYFARREQLWAAYRYG